MCNNNLVHWYLHYQFQKGCACIGEACVHALSQLGAYVMHSSRQKLGKSITKKANIMGKGE